MIGKRIGGRYDIIKIIGEGGMSRVFLAHDAILNRDVAIKVLNYDFANEEDLKRRFQREALSATSLTHPHIVDIFDVGEDGEIHYLVMEYIEGQTLKKHIQLNGPMAPKEAVPIMRQLVSAISNAHHNGIVHRDVKPQNILMDAEGNVKITDFGIAMALSSTDHTKTNSVIGTVHYLSPEQARGGMATKKSDIYSLGIVFYELLTGELPFSAESAVAIALKHLQEETPSVRAFSSAISQSVENVILKATAKDATYRYRSADEMYDDLLTVLSSERSNEKKFVIPFDDDRTRAIPAISNPTKFKEVETTKKIEPVILEKATEPKKKKKKWPLILASIGGVLILLLLLLLLPGMLGPKKGLIPNVIGLDEKAAVDLLEKEGFIADARTEQPNEEFQKGEVIQTIPEADKKRELGTSVKLFISSGKETAQLADYTDKDYEQIATLLDNFNFKSIKPIYKFSDKPKGTILEQDPIGNSELIPSETDLVFTVSKGKDMVTVGNLLGYTSDQLSQYEKSSSFKISSSSAFSETVERGRVSLQKPDVNTELERGSTISVVISKGPEQKRVKWHYKKVIIKYEEIAQENNDDEDSETEQQERAPQKIQIFVRDKSHSMNDPVEEFTIVEDTIKTISLEIEEGTTAGYRIMRDSTEIINETVDYKDAK